jgi:hypothetical protein
MDSERHRTHVHYSGGVTPDQLAHRDALKHRFNILVSTCQHTPNPVDDLDGWRRRWTEIHGLVAEIDALDAEPPPSG